MTRPANANAVLRVDSEMIPQLRTLFADCLDLLRDKLHELQRGGRMVDPWMNDPVSMRMRDLYNERAMDAPDGGYSALRAYEAELKRVYDTLDQMERNYRTTEDENTALFEGRA